MNEEHYQELFSSNIASSSESKLIKEHAYKVIKSEHLNTSSC